MNRHEALTMTSLGFARGRARAGLVMEYVHVSLRTSNVLISKQLGEREIMPCERRKSMQSSTDPAFMICRTYIQLQIKCKFERRARPFACELIAVRSRTVVNPHVMLETDRLIHFECRARAKQYQPIVLPFLRLLISE